MRFFHFQFEYALVMLSVSLRYCYIVERSLQSSIYLYILYLNAIIKQFLCVLFVAIKYLVHSLDYRQKAPVAYDTEAAGFVYDINTQGTARASALLAE